VTAAVHGGGFKPRIWYDRRTASWLAAVPAVRYSTAAVAVCGSHATALARVRRFYADAAAPLTGGTLTPPDGVPGILWNVFEGQRVADDLGPATAERWSDQFYTGGSALG
jgi:hypothetical protein